MTNELTCQELVELVSSYLDDALSAGERARFDAHLATCPGCVAYVDQIRTTVRLTGEQLHEDSLSAEAREVLLAQFRNWQESSA
jgi:anti-sigma factor RsiW